MSETWYRTRRYHSAIEPVEVVKATSKTVVVNEWAFAGQRNERKSNITSDYSQHFRTWEEARAHLIERAEDRVKSLRLQLEQANGHLGNVKGLKKPEDA